MSFGSFRASKYELDNGDIHPIRVQPETEALSIGGANDAPTGAISGQGSATVGKGIRENGIGARLVSLRWDGAPPTGYDPTGTIRLPILQKTLFDAISLGDTGTYLGGTVVVVGKSPERIR